MIYSNILQIWKNGNKLHRFWDVQITEYNLSSLVTYNWLSNLLITSFLVPVKYTWNSNNRYVLNRPKWLTAPYAHRLTFRAGNILHSTKSVLGPLSGLLQDMGCHPAASLSVTVVWRQLRARMTCSKHYWQCNWRLAFESLSMSAACSKRFEQLLWLCLFSHTLHETFNF